MVFALICSIIDVLSMRKFSSPSCTAEWFHRARLPAALKSNPSSINIWVIFSRSCASHLWVQITICIRRSEKNITEILSSRHIPPPCLLMSPFILKINFFFFFSKKTQPCLFILWTYWHYGRIFKRTSYLHFIEGKGSVKIVLLIGKTSCLVCSWQ